MTGTMANMEIDAQQTKAGRMLAAILEMLDSHGISYCIPHGYGSFAAMVASDVDMIVDAQVSARDLQRLLHEAAPSFGARLVRCRGRHFFLSLRDGEGPHTFVTLDVDTSSEFDGVTFFTAKEMLQGHCCPRGPYAGDPLPHLDDTPIRLPLL